MKRDRAMVYAQKANELAPDQPAFQDTLAMLLSEKGEHAKALELQKKVVTAQPRNALFRLNLVRIHMNAGHKDLAKIELDELNNLGEKFAGHQEVKRLLKLL
jgi:predicted Zn-dependent protease